MVYVYVAVWLPLCTLIRGSYKGIITPASSTTHMKAVKKSSPPSPVLMVNIVARTADNLAAPGPPMTPQHGHPSWLYLLRATPCER